MPKYRQLPHDAAPLAAPMIVPAEATSLVTPALVLAVLLATAGAFLTARRTELVGAALLIALPATVAAIRSARRRATGDRPARVLRRPGATDALTGAADESAWHDAVDAALGEEHGDAITLARISLELPAASELVDTDRLLVVSAVRWQEILRPGDTLARLGAADFAVLLPRCDAGAARTVLSRLRAAVPDANPSHAAVATWDGDETPGALERRLADAVARAREARVVAPLSDPDRLAAVAATGLAVRETTAEFDAVARSVAWMLDVPVVVVTLFDERWQHYVGAHGVSEGGAPTEGTPAEDAVCRETVETGQPLVVSDAGRHPVLCHVPATTQFGIGACASLPVRDSDGHVLGSICAMVDHRHQWSAPEIDLLRLTARRIGTRLAEIPVEGIAV